MDHFRRLLPGHAVDTCPVEDLGGLVHRQDTVAARTGAFLDCPTPWSESWAVRAAADLRGLRDPFARAAAAGDAAIVRETA